MSAALGLAGRPAEAEEIVVARDLAIARATGGRLHLCHLSIGAAPSSSIRRAKAEGVRVTAEVTPHHLAFTDDDLVTYDTNLKVHPPLRTAEDRDALRDGLADGTIDAIATDHAPHAVEEKEAEFDRSPPGTIGLETALAAVIMTELVEPGLLPLVACARRLIDDARADPGRRPATAARSSPGARRTSWCSIRPRSWTVEPPFARKARNSAFLGRTLTRARPHTMLRGDARVADGKPTPMTREPAAALLALEDGTVFRGTAFGHDGETFGEAVFNTGMAGYQEVLTDPVLRAARSSP